MSSGIAGAPGHSRLWERVDSNVSRSKTFVEGFMMFKFAQKAVANVNINFRSSIAPVQTKEVH